MAKATDTDLTPIKTMGGFEIIPDINVHSIILEEGDFKILPGDNTWKNEKNQEINNIIHKNPDMDITVAAICGAITALTD